VQKSLTETETIITFFLTDNVLFAFNISKNNFKVDKINVTRSKVKKLISRISALYSKRPNDNDNDIYFNQDLFSFDSEASNEFYNTVLKNVISSIPKDEKIIFSLPTEMALIPMEFLVTQFKEGDSPFFYDNKNFLIEKYAVSYTPSVSVLMLQKGISNSNNTQVLLVGDPEISNKDFAASYRGGLLEDNSFKSRSIALFPLKYSRQEIEKISDLFSDKAILLSKDATEKNFKKNASQSNIIHLSTHSFLYKDQPLIVFSQSSDDSVGEDGYLEAGEIHQLKLNSNMVVLSTCRSGVGSVDIAEGILGMQKSFFEAGAKSIVVSMWDVNDKYTSLFMQRFYKYLSEGDDKSEALRQTKIFFKKNYSANPYYWAAFVLSGNISPIEISKDNHFPSLPIFLLFILLIALVTIYIRVKLA
jgi:CHAT domain-containing protein